MLKTPRADTAVNISLQLYQLPDTILKESRVVKGSSAEFSVSSYTKYLIKLSSVTYEAINRNLDIAGKPVTITLELKKKSTTLQNVVVVSKKPLVKQEDDKTVVDAAVLANSSTNAMEVMEKTPGVIIDQDGNVYLNSMTPATVFINGREMKLSSADLASLLKSMPAGSISKIEILRNPSAKFDASSSGGIVNIVLKKGVKLGSNGSFNLAYFQGIYSTQTAGVNINKNAGKLNSYLSYQFTKRNNYEELNSDRQIRTDSSLLAQRAYTTYPSLNNYFGGGLDFELTKKFNIGYDLRINQSASKSHALNSNDVFQGSGFHLTGEGRIQYQQQQSFVYIGNNFHPNTNSIQREANGPLKWITITTITRTHRITITVTISRSDPAFRETDPPAM
ncbi:MAG: hypothetical protein IPI66_04680 [Chitinophagaceae bacterium]|nr:hypothetical protein [Chitinophagaceae bacterium]